MIKNKILQLIKRELIRHYKDNLVSLCVFGSFARETFTPFSDLDLLIICENLKKERLKRVKDFEKIEKELEKRGYKFLFSPVIKTKEEVLRGSPLFFDMIGHSLILYDKGKFFSNYLERLKEKLENLGARRIERKDYWFWILKKDYNPGEVFSL